MKKQKAEPEQHGQAAEPAAPSTIAEEVAPAETEAMDTTSPAKAATKRPLNSPSKEPKSSPRKALMRSVPTGMQRISNAGAGDCLFLSIAQGLNFDKPKPHRSIRAAVVTHLKKHSERYKPWWDEKTPDEEHCASWEEYLKLVAKTGAYAGCLEIAAAAAHFDKQIFVFGPAMHCEVYNDTSVNGYICLWYDSKHYELLQGSLPEALRAAACKGPLQGGRGGVAHSKASSSAATRTSALPSVCSGRTRKSALPAAFVPRISNVAIASSAGSVISRAESQRVKDVHVDPDELHTADPKRSVQAAASSSKPSAKPTKNEAKEWICPECGFWTGVKTNWVWIRRQHVLTWHADKKDEYNFHRTPDLVPWNPDTCLWKCPLCPQGLSNKVSDKDLQRRMRIAHAKRCHPSANRKQFLCAGNKARQANARKATVVKTSAGIASKLVALKAGEQGDHDCEIMQLLYDAWTTPKLSDEP